MVEPMLWNTLSEAADWLSEKTGDKWSPRKIMSFAIDHYHNPNFERKKQISQLTGESRVVSRRTNFYSKKELEITCHFSNRTHLSVMLPLNMRIGVYRYIKDLMSFHSDYKTVAGKLVRTNELVVRAAPLYVRNLSNVFMYGEDKISSASPRLYEHKENSFIVGWEFGLFEPLNGLTPRIIRDLRELSYAKDGDLLLNKLAEIGDLYPITVDMVGVIKEDLERLFSDYQKTKDSHNPSYKESQSVADQHRSIPTNTDVPQQSSEIPETVNEDEFSEEECLLYDPLTKRQIHALFDFITMDQWSKFFDKAVRNGLGNARCGMDGRAHLYNPAKVANWLIHKGECKPERAVKILVNNLPQRSKNSREDLLAHRGF